MSITDEQLKSALQMVFGSNSYTVIHQALEERDTTIAELREQAAVDDDHRNIGAALMETLARAYPRYSWCNCPTEVVWDLLNERDDAVKELAELRKPVAVERNELVEAARARRKDARSYEISRWIADFDDVLQAYDTTAQDLARANSAHDAVMAEMRGLRERLDTALIELADARYSKSIEIGAAQERERQLREALLTIAAWQMPATGRTWDDGTPMSYSAVFGSIGERDHIISVARAALAQPQQTKFCEFEDCDVDPAPGSTLCQGHIDDNARIAAEEQQRLAQHQPAIVAVDHEGKAVQECKPGCPAIEHQLDGAQCWWTTCTCGRFPEESSNV